MLRMTSMLLGWVLCCSCALAEETFEIKSPVAKPGDVIKAVNLTSSDGSMRIVDLKVDLDDIERLPTAEEKQAALAALNEQTKSARESVRLKQERVAYQDVILETSGNRITRRRREYEQPSLDSAPQLPLPKSAIVIEQIGERFSFYKEDGPELVGEQAAALREDFNEASELFKDSDFLPQSPVMLREQWPINAAEVAKQFAQQVTSLGMPIKPETATGFGMLQRVYRQQERTYGVIVYTLRLPLNFNSATDKASIAKSGDSADATERPKLGYLMNAPRTPGSIEFTIIQDCPIDGRNGSTQTETRIKVKGDMSQVVEPDFLEFLMHFDFTVTLANRQTLVVK